MTISELADIFIVDSSYEVKKKSIISAQTDEAVLRYRARKFDFLQKFEIFYGTIFYSILIF